jgi:hypothetical protein
MKLFFPKESKLGTEICCEASTRADFKRIVQHLQEQFGSKVKGKAEGPDSIAWKLMIEEKIVVISLSDWGLFPLSVSSQHPSAHDLITRIGRSLETLSAAN